MNNEIPIKRFNDIENNMITPNIFWSTEPLTRLNKPKAIQKNMFISMVTVRKNVDDFKKLGLWLPMILLFVLANIIKKYI